VFIYCLKDPAGNIRYIGKTKKISERFRRHISDARRNETGHKAIWIRSLLARGQQPSIERLMTCTSAVDLNEAERSWIAWGHQIGLNLTNLTEGGEGAYGHNPSKETRARMSNAKKGKPGRPISLETRNKIRERIQGIKRSAETRNKISIAKGGRPFKDQNGAIFVTQSECARKLGLDQRNISSVLRRIYHHTGGYRFSYLGEG
jgi:group I intron endonuclease